MLNELRELSVTLKEAGINVQDWHPSFDSCVRNAVRLPDKQNGSNKARKTSGYLTFRLIIGDEGQVIDLASASQVEDVSEIRKWKQNNNNGFSFPAFNVSPLLKLNNPDSAERISKLKRIGVSAEVDWAGETVNIISESSTAWVESDIRQINCCLKEVPDDILKRLGEIPCKYSSILRLCNRAKRLTATSLHKDLVNLVIQKIKDGHRDLSLIGLLFCIKNSKKIQLVCDIDDWHESADYPPNNKTTQRWMNVRFIKYSELERETRFKPNALRDAFNEDLLGADEKFPSVRLPILDKVILRSMYKDKPCQYRYGMIESKSFSVGDKVKREMKGALDWLGGYGGKDRKEKTWCNITNKVGKRTVLFAYPTKKPDLAPELAGLMGGIEEADSNDASFSAIAASVINALKSISVSSSDNEVRIFVLSKMDKARTKVVARRHFTSEHIIESAGRWQGGCRNIPNIKIMRLKDNKEVWGKCLIPFPAEVVWCLNTIWKREGTDPELVKVFSINDAFKLLLDDDYEAKRLSIKAIDVMIRNGTSLVLAIKQENRLERVFKIKKTFERQALLLPSILGLLLYKNGIMKGEFMNSSAYLLGRLLSLFDDLHLKYCQQVRKGSIPPQLVGNALMSTALEMPEKALSILSQRILPYWAWADTLSNSEKDVGLIKYFLKQIGDISNQLKEAGLSQTCTDTDKAQMLLGYLARAEID